jgi:hypothetical protein
MKTNVIDLAKLKAQRKRKEIEAQYVAFYGNSYAKVGAAK